ncbi:MAG: hypothetical protein ACLTMP_12540 [Eggerthella lenta]
MKYGANPVPCSHGGVVLRVLTGSSSPRLLSMFVVCSAAVRAVCEAVTTAGASPLRRSTQRAYRCPPPTACWKRSAEPSWRFACRQQPTRTVRLLDAIDKLRRPSSSWLHPTPPRTRRRSPARRRRHRGAIRGHVGVHLVGAGVDMTDAGDELGAAWASWSRWR